MLRKDNGFTLVEMLVSLVIFMIIASFVLNLFTLIQTNTTEKSSLNQKEWEIFINQLKRDVWQSRTMEASHNKLYLTVGEDMVLIEQYQDKVRRRLNETGHEIALQNIRSFQVISDGNSVTVTVEDKQGKPFRSRLRPFISVSGGSTNGE
ncbi:competence type IV pilus minor pilin ComGF [Bacillus sp. V59.32b]|uniref:competence type IV pilus minor pilin ComGF n=1 Tax=Bacillus sp. V59.32b TaxID=1758642 RepID=UPI000E3D6338|nr:competence type IV pilus minor pilin ComGF [Bacillus sp. V59.32b]RFU61953.1 prepilin-type N-terminal cleavage/methylation domain-containing protein [Bacillus sp. V59.32b]